jgi:molybdopterin-guanine dinucleotide biosynthesis protein B
MADPSSNKSPEQKGVHGNLPLVVSLVSRSGAGKTTFLEKLLPKLKEQGLSVGVLKHHAHPTPFDVPGKDTYRLSEAGADIVVGASPVQTAIFIAGDASSNPGAVIQRHLVDVDLVLTEGFKRGRYPKIEIHRSRRGEKDERETGLLCDVAELLAVVTDVELPLPPAVPQFALNDAAGVASFLSDLTSTI